MSKITLWCLLLHVIIIAMYILRCTCMKRYGNMVLFHDFKSVNF